MSLRKYHYVIIAANEAARYTQCLRPHRKLILTAILLKVSQIPFLRDVAHIVHMY